MAAEKVTIIETLVFGTFAAVGGLLSYMMRTLNREQTPLISKAIVECFGSAFVGILAMLACKALAIDWMWSGVIVGVFGWVGAEASIVMLTRLIRKRLGIDSAIKKDS